MNDPITINIDAGWITRAWACVPKTKADFYALPGKLAGKFANSVMWAVYHTQVWLALFVTFIAGAALSPLARPHLARYDVPMVEAENVAPRPININLGALQASLDAIQRDQAALAKQLATTQTAVISTQGNVTKLIAFTDGLPALLMTMNPFQPAPAPAAVIEKPKPRPVAKRPPAATPEPAQAIPAAPQPEPSTLEIIKGYLPQLPGPGK